MKSLANSTGQNFRIGRRAPLIVVPARLNGRAGFRFVIDTGAASTLVTPRIAHLVSIEREGEARAVGAGGSVEAWHGRLDSLRIANQEATDLTVTVVDLAGTR